MEGLWQVSYRLVSGDLGEVQACKGFLRKLLGGERSKVKTWELREWSHKSSRTFSLKRSPHVFSKSQENFGQEEHTVTVRVRTFRGGKVFTRRRAQRVLLAAGHYFPGVQVTGTWHSGIPDANTGGYLWGKQRGWQEDLGKHRAEEEERERERRRELRREEEPRKRATA